MIKKENRAQVATDRQVQKFPCFITGCKTDEGEGTQNHCEEKQHVTTKV